ncbi:aminotransferase class IV [Desulfocurvus sp.]|jgi:branched-chain amino acid aminotransferase|uniref:aminotransferase class IV n=1 Tax=Desulfocurvus sp. TaxID=2871698 RepID=UPI0025B9C840|nr:aminotransferase class IV [Desulfocurvus sp.]MCK9239657.1 aminotransferase class IV [Desulfocurvus sp.]
MISVLDSEDYLRRMLAVKRPGTGEVLAFYEHRIGAVCKDPRLMLIPLDDHIVHRGDGIFETMKYLGRRVYQLDAHLARMRRGADAIGLTPPCTWERLREIVLEVCQAGGSDDGLVRILLGRGPGGFGIDPRECPLPSLYVVAYRFTPKPAHWFEKGATAFRTAIPAKQDWIAQIKSVNYLPNVLMKREASAQGYDYPICFDDNGFVAEGATENMAIVDEAGTLVIPEFTNALPGTTLIRAVELLAGRVKAFFRKVTEEDLYHAREVLVFGTTGDCLAIVRYNGKPIHDVRPGPVCRLARELIVKDIAENGVPF